MLSICFIHAFPLNSNMWREQMKYFSTKARCIAVDLPGFGGTPDDVISENPSMHEYASYVERIVQSIVRRDKGHKLCVVGLSMGGYVAMYIIRRGLVIPDFLVLANTRSQADSEEAKQRRFKIIEEIEKKKSIEPVISAYLPALAPDNGKLKEDILNMVKLTSPGGARKALYAMATRDDSTDYVKSFSGKLLCIGSEKDALSPPEIVRSMCRNDKEFKVIEGCGHLSAMERPDIFNKILEDFLEI
jgi:3-oxoadipate enol-lactonase